MNRMIRELDLEVEALVEVFLAEDLETTEVLEDSEVEVSEAEASVEVDPAENFNFYI